MNRRGFISVLLAATARCSFGLLSWRPPSDPIVAESFELELNRPVIVRMQGALDGMYRGDLSFEDYAKLSATLQSRASNPTI